MLAATLLLLLLGLVTRILIPLLQYSRWTMARSELLQAAALAARYVVGDLQRAPMEGLSLAQPGLFSIHGLDEVTDTGAEVWDSKLIVYQWESSGRSLHRVLAPGDLSAPLRPDLAQMQTWLSDASLARRTLVRGLMQEFQLETSGPHQLPLRLRMLLSQEVPGRPPQTYEHFQILHLRNGSDG